MNNGGIFGIYLAAGKSSRMGFDKLLLPLGSMPLGSLALHTALMSQLDRILVVTKEEDSLDWIDPSLLVSPLCEKWCSIPCATASQGQAYSLRCGLQEAQRGEAKAVMILLADQPFVSCEMINELIFHYKKSLRENKQCDYVAASYQEILRPPILFSNQLFPVLLKMQGDKGARQLLRKGAAFEGITIEYEDAREFHDVDTEEEYFSF
ncbi:NTP transferase domain-containing protein [Aneurinibacillus uraniidurans]|uniref:NTP transferase domain-containing protein n=1 Tax=Aneurinibacillus uraniidurans TaxID=2966586 RepID=UPI00234AAD84|nr:NTP transferase domain-containing protein [Aneurinibacillus sp. B1]WCN36274.1 NTP transferase domain-containing protein [Aneurinibacillus sp. B1]